MDLGVAGDRFLALPIGPDVMPSTRAEEPPAELPKRFLQLLSLHPLTVHGYVYDVNHGTFTA